jgi:hypothetical protein
MKVVSMEVKRVEQRRTCNMHSFTHLMVNEQCVHYSTSFPVKVAYQFIRIGHSELKLLDAFEAHRTVSKIFGCHAERRCAGLVGIGKVSSASTHDD